MSHWTHYHPFSSFDKNCSKMNIHSSLCWRNNNKTHKHTHTNLWTKYWVEKRHHQQSKPEYIISSKFIVMVHIRNQTTIQQKIENHVDSVCEMCSVLNHAPQHNFKTYQLTNSIVKKSVSKQYFTRGTIRVHYDSSWLDFSSFIVYSVNSFNSIQTKTIIPWIQNSGKKHATIII